MAMTELHISNGPSKAELPKRELELIALKEKLEAERSDDVFPDNAEVLKGFDPELVREWTENWGVDKHLETGRANVREAMSDLDDTERGQLESSFETDLPPPAKTQVYRFLAIDAGAWRPAEQSYIDEVANSGPEFRALVDSWGREAPRMVGRARGRSRLMLETMSAAEAAATEAWFQKLPNRQAVAVIRGLAGRRSKR